MCSPVNLSMSIRMMAAKRVELEGTVHASHADRVKERTERTNACSVCRRGMICISLDTFDEIPNFLDKAGLNIAGASTAGLPLFSATR